LTEAVEGAEDSAAQGVRDLRAARVTKKAVVVGLTASGSAPYVLEALRYARRLGAVTIGVTSNRRSPIVRLARITIAPRTGPEAIAGSTRLKAGTAQKLVLNMLSTTAMVRLGRVYDNWMTNMALTNRKLRRRGLRILEQATGASLSEAQHALRQAGHDLRAALLMLLTGATAPEARRRLAAARGNLREALDGGTRPAGSRRRS
jgi:N-acetylmuramic acid 6-phosphate etherase